MANIYNKIEADWLKRNNDEMDKLMQFWKGKYFRSHGWAIFNGIAAVIGWVYIIIIILNK